MKGHQQPTGRAQSPPSSAFPIIILLDNFLSSTLKVLVDGHGAQNGSLGELPGFAVNSGTRGLIFGTARRSQKWDRESAFLVFFY